VWHYSNHVDYNILCTIRNKKNGEDHVAYEQVVCKLMCNIDEFDVRNTFY
jgi:hypothetical protein